MRRTFETAALGHLPAGAVLECGVCWWRYDPCEGDELGGILPGTPFTALPEDWRCPSCDTEKAKFLLPEGGLTGPMEAAATTWEATEKALIGAYRKAESSIVGLPVHNSALDIETVGFRPYGNGHAGVLVTPWCMNIVVVPDDTSDAPGGAIGSQADLPFPSGLYTFTLAHLDGVGLLQSCSLFSPMDEFSSQADAIEAAQAAADALFTETQAEEDAVPKAEEPSRRVLFTFSGQAR